MTSVSVRSILPKVSNGPRNVFGLSDVHRDGRCASLPPVAYNATRDRPVSSEAIAYGAGNDHHAPSVVASPF